MAMRKHFGVGMGRPPKTAASRMPKAPKMGGVTPTAPMGAAPMDSFSPALPAASFKRGGSVGGYSTMPRHHDDPMHNAPSSNGFTNTKRGC